MTTSVFAVLGMLNLNFAPVVKKRLALSPGVFCLFFLLLPLTLTQCQLLPTPTPQPSTPIVVPSLQPGDGTDLLDQLLERGRIRVGIRVWPDPDFSPPAFRDVSSAAIGGALTGFEVETAELIATGLGLELELVQADPQTIISGDWQGEWDVAMASLAPTAPRPPDAPGQSLTYSLPYAYLPMGVLIPGEEENIETFDDLSGRTVGALEYTLYQDLLTPGPDQGALQQRYLTTFAPADVTLVPLSNLPKSIRSLGDAAQSDEIQLKAIFGPTPIFQQAIERDLPVKLAPEAKRVGWHPLSVAAVPRDGLTPDRLVSEINQTLLRLQEQGTLAEVQYRWYGQDLSVPVQR